MLSLTSPMYPIWAKALRAIRGSRLVAWVISGITGTKSNSISRTIESSTCHTSKGMQLSVDFIKYHIWKIENCVYLCKITNNWYLKVKSGSKRIFLGWVPYTKSKGKFLKAAALKNVVVHCEQQGCSSQKSAVQNFLSVFRCSVVRIQCTLLLQFRKLLQKSCAYFSLNLVSKIAVRWVTKLWRTFIQLLKRKKWSWNISKPGRITRLFCFES